MKKEEENTASETHVTQPTLGVLKIQKLMSPSYLSTLQQWGALPDVVPVPDASNLLATLCGQNKAAILKIVVNAIETQEIRFWGMSHKDGWIENFVRILHPLNGKPKIRLPTATAPGTFSIPLKKEGRLHIEAMGINPADMVELLRKRGRKVPSALVGFFEQRPDGADVVSTSSQKVPVSRAVAQDEAILQAINVMGLDPLALARPAAGKAGIKAEIRKRLTKERRDIFVSRQVFDDAWQRLRGQGDIRDR